MIRRFLAMTSFLIGAVLIAAGLSVIASTASSASLPTTTLYNGQALTVGQTLTSPNGQYFAVLQSDGNFVVYNAQDHAIWATGTSGGTLLTVQGDGNIVLYAGSPGSFRPVWATGTSSLSSAFLVMQDDGNLVAYNAVQPLWSSKSGLLPISPVGIGVNQPMYSPSKQYMALLQTDGNFVVYRVEGAPTAIWSTGTGGTGASVLLIQGDGNVVLYAGSRPVWATSTHSGSGVNLEIQDDGNLVLYAGTRPLWASGTDIAFEVVSIAKTQLGYAENPLGTGCNAFTAFFGRGSTSGCAPGTASESWCSDYANWVWLESGAGITGITGWSYTYVYYGQQHGTFRQGASNDPQPGDAVVWGDMTQQYGAHVGTVVAVRSDGWIEVVNGNDGNSHVSMTGFFNPTGSTVDGYPIVGYTTPLPAGVAAVQGGAPVLEPTPTQEQINSQH